MPEQVIEQMQSESVQARARQRDEVGFVSVSLLHWLSQAGTIAPPWWSKRRDRFLRNFWKQEDHLAGAIYTLGAKLTSVPVRVEPRTPAVRAHRKQAEDFTIKLVEASEFGQSWMTLFGKSLRDLWGTDNGFFLEVIGEGKKDGPIVGPALGLAHLDSWRCTRTRDIDFPVIYEDTDGSRFKLHRTRVVYYSQMSSEAVEMNGVGFGAVSRVLNNVQHLLDISTYEQEKLGSRPKRQILITGGGVGPDDVETAFRMADRSMDAQGLSRYSKAVMIGDRSIQDPTAVLNFIDLAATPDGFDKQQSITLGMFAIALAFAVPPRWLWPASVTGATKADAMFQHIAGLGGGAGQTLRMMSYLLGGSDIGTRHMAGKFLPPHLKLVFDFQDDEQDRMRAEVRTTRAERRKIDLETGVVSIRVAREQALADGDLTKAQFSQLELDDGRLEDGGDVLTLFSGRDDRMRKLLDVGVKEPLIVSDNDQAEVMANIDRAVLKVQGILTGVGTAGEQARAKQALAALAKLKVMYEEAQPTQRQPELELEPEEVEEETKEAEGEKSHPFELKLSRSFRDLETSGAADYRRMLRAAVRGLWTGAFGRDSFWDAMFSGVARGFRRAWRDGAKECGIEFDELSDAELRRLNERIDYELRWINGFADAIEAGSRAEGGKLTPLYVRAEIWIGRFEGVKTEARVMACADKKLKWNLGAAEEHCSSCVRLNGKVKRASWWNENGILPRAHGAPYLACGGWRCTCELQVTDEPMSRGRMPSLP